MRTWLFTLANDCEKSFKKELVRGFSLFAAENANLNLCRAFVELDPLVPWLRFRRFMMERRHDEISRN